jgi:hypothetical protein
MADGSGYGKRNPWQLEKSTYKHEAHPAQAQTLKDACIAAEIAA